MLRSGPLKLPPPIAHVRSIQLESRPQEHLDGRGSRLSGDGIMSEMRAVCEIGEEQWCIPAEQHEARDSACVRISRDVVIALDAVGAPEHGGVGTPSHRNSAMATAIAGPIPGIAPSTATPTKHSTVNQNSRR